MKTIQNIESKSLLFNLPTSTVFSAKIFLNDVIFFTRSLNPTHSYSQNLITYDEQSNIEYLTKMKIYSMFYGQQKRLIKDLYEEMVLNKIIENNLKFNKNLNQSHNILLSYYEIKTASLFSQIKQSEVYFFQNNEEISDIYKVQTRQSCPDIFISYPFKNVAYDIKLGKPHNYGISRLQPIFFENDNVSAVFNIFNHQQFCTEKIQTLTQFMINEENIFLKQKFNILINNIQKCAIKEQIILFNKMDYYIMQFSNRNYYSEFYLCINQKQPNLLEDNEIKFFKNTNLITYMKKSSHIDLEKFLLFGRKKNLDFTQYFDN